MVRREVLLSYRNNAVNGSAKFVKHVFTIVDNCDKWTIIASREAIFYGSFFTLKRRQLLH